MLKKLCALCFLLLSYQEVMAQPGYRYNLMIDPKTGQAGDILVQYSDPSNPCWVYLFWINSQKPASTTSSTTPIVQTPLPGQDYRTVYVPNEAIRKMDEAALIDRAIRDFNGLISSGLYALNKDSYLKSLATFNPKPSSLSFEQVLLYNDPQLRIALDQTKLVEIGLSSLEILLLESRRLLPSSGLSIENRTLGEFVIANQRKLDWSDILGDQSADSNLLKKTVLDLLDRSHQEIASSANRMTASWTEQRNQLSASKQ